MLITCPSCAAEYNVPGPLAPGRVVRCARCATEWAPTKRPPAVEAPVIEAPVIEAPVIAVPMAGAAGITATTDPAGPGSGHPPPARTAAPKPTQMALPAVRGRPARLPLLVAWGSSVLLLALVGVAAVVWREPVMQGWPPSIRVYDAFGLTTHP